MGNVSKATTTVIAQNGNYTIKHKGRRTVVFEVTSGGVVSDKSGAAVLSSDIAVVKSAFILNGLSDMAGRVQKWWDGR
jgi:adenine deaminase